MIAIINNLRYDTKKCEDLGEYDHHNNGNYSGTTHLLRASDGRILEHTDTNGQDCYLRDSVTLFGGECDRYDMTAEQAARCHELGLIKIID